MKELSCVNGPPKTEQDIKIFFLLAGGISATGGSSGSSSGSSNGAAGGAGATGAAGGAAGTLLCIMSNVENHFYLGAVSQES